MRGGGLDLSRLFDLDRLLVLLDLVVLVVLLVLDRLFAFGRLVRNDRGFFFHYRCRRRHDRGGAGAAGGARRYGCGGRRGLGCRHARQGDFAARGDRHDLRTRGPLVSAERCGGAAALASAGSAIWLAPQFAGTERKFQVTGISVHLAVFPDEETGSAGLGGKRADQQCDMMRVAEPRLEERQVVGVQRDAFARVAAEESRHPAAGCQPCCMACSKRPISASLNRYSGPRL